MEKELVPGPKQPLMLKIVNEPILAERLLKISMPEFSDFVAMTGLACRVGGKRYAPLGVVFAVQLAMIDYIKLKEQPHMFHSLETYKRDIVSCILEDHPAALKHLVANNEI